MFLLLCGVGVGYSVQSQHISKLPVIRGPLKRKKRYLVADSIEGWSDVIKILFKAYYFGLSDPQFDYSIVRPKGSRLKTSGGKAPGPQPLKDAVYNIRKILDSKEVGSQLTSLEVHDIMCFLAEAVISGGIRRSAMISLFSYDDSDMLHCKFGEWWNGNQQRAMANNSATLARHKVTKEIFDEMWKKVELSNSGEPGLYFNHNPNGYGTNPCAEIALRSNQFCNLCEVNVSDVVDQNDYNERIRVAAFIGTLQAGYTDFHYLREVWKETTEKEALLGIGMTGIASGKVLSLNMKEAANIAKKENERVAKLIGINKAARITTVKPSGSSSLVLGCSSGIHAWHSAYYIRTMRLIKNEPLCVYLTKNLPMLVEDDVFNPNQAVIKIPIKAPEGAIMRTESAIDMLERVKKVYLEWIRPGHRSGDNTHNVSATVSVRPEEWQDVGEWMWKNRDCYNGLSVLPYDNGSYVQAPYQECTKEEYESLMQYLQKVDLSQIIEDDDMTELKDNLACVAGNCEIK
jgi:ribonucleoside-diphosphate reductase alpha chain